jgi:hypothetical protein
MQVEDMIARGAIRDAPGGGCVVRRAGRFVLVRAEGGFFWTFADLAGARWYWHPGERRWTGSPQASPTPEGATEGLDPEAPQAEVQFHHHEAPTPLAALMLAPAGRR